MDKTSVVHQQTGLAPEQQEKIAAAAQILCSGGTVAFPTETVYGLGADAVNPSAIQKIYRIKQRPVDHPLIIHIGAISDLHHWTQTIPGSAWKLAQHFWPGPLTLILPRSARIPDCVTGGQDTVGLRMPAHPIALALLHTLGPEKALAAPSANRFGRISPTAAAHVQQELGTEVDMILDGGACQVGLESTIISFHDGIPQILRPGGITPAAIEAVLQSPVLLPHHRPQTIRASGTLLAHYAPTTPLQLYPAAELWRHALVLAKQGLRILVITWSDRNRSRPALSESIEQCIMPSDPAAYGQQLYARLRQFDQLGYDYLLVETPPDHPGWLAITDRLQRASYH